MLWCSHWLLFGIHFGRHSSKQFGYWVRSQCWWRQCKPCTTPRAFHLSMPCRSASLVLFVCIFDSWDLSPVPWTLAWTLSLAATASAGGHAHSRLVAPSSSSLGPWRTAWSSFLSYSSVPRHRCCPSEAAESSLNTISGWLSSRIGHGGADWSHGPPTRSLESISGSRQGRILQGRHFRIWFGARSINWLSNSRSWWHFRRSYSWNWRWSWSTGA